ncbi:alpha/beta-hydrolase, partial [Fistulina hepatica ATCC 64428]
PEIHHFVAPDGALLVYTTYGDTQMAGKALIVVATPGWGVSSWFAARTFHRFIARGPVLVLSSRGTDVLPQFRPDKHTMSTVQMAHDLDALRTHLNLTSFPVLAGYAHGGTIALTFAELYPERVDRLILAAHRLDVEVDAQESISALEQLADDPRFAASVEALFNQGPLDNDEEFTKHLSAQGITLDDVGVPPMSSWCMRNLTECDGRDEDLIKRRVEALSNVTARTLIVFGKQDRICSVAGAERTRRGIPNSQLHLIDECGHALWLEKPEAFWRILFDFLPD